MQTKYIFSWEDFKSYLTSELYFDSTNRSKYIFRGQSSEQWTLTSPFDRIFANKELTKRIKIEERLILEFKTILQDYIWHKSPFIPDYIGKNGKMSKKRNFLIIREF